MATLGDGVPQFVNNMSAAIWEYKVRLVWEWCANSTSLSNTQGSLGAMGLASTVSLALLGLCSLVRAQTSAADAYVSAESPIAQAGILANIGPSGSKSHGAASGVIIASPSTSNPDYLYTWTRDAALVSRALVDE